MHSLADSSRLRAAAWFKCPAILGSDTAQDHRPCLPQERCSHARPRTCERAMYNAQRRAMTCSAFQPLSRAWHCGQRCKQEATSPHVGFSPVLHLRYGRCTRRCVRQHTVSLHRRKPSTACINSWRWARSCDDRTAVPELSVVSSGYSVTWSVTYMLPTVTATCFIRRRRLHLRSRRRRIPPVLKHMPHHRSRTC